MFNVIGIDLLKRVEDLDNANIDTSMVLGELESLIDAILEAGYLDHASVPGEPGDHVLRLLSLCRRQAARARELHEISESGCRGLVAVLQASSPPAKVA